VTTDRIERRLPQILADLSLPETPDYLDDLLDRTARTRQRPGWTFLERWLPMDIAMRPAVHPRLPWRALAAAGLLILVVLAALVVYVGSSPPRPAPLFGPASNGSLVFDRDGDIFVIDPQFAGERMLIGGETDDFGVRWSLDGARLYFGRAADGRTHVMAADPDGGNVRLVSNALTRASDVAELSPDASQLVVINTERPVPQLEVLALDGSNDRTVLDLGGIEPTRFAAWRPPDAAEIVFLGNPFGDGSTLGLYAIHPDGTGLRTIAVREREVAEPEAVQISFQDMVLSDDGSLAAYWSWEPGVVAGKSCLVHVIDLVTGQDRRLTFDPTAQCELAPQFLGGDQLLIERQDVPAGNVAGLLVVSLEGRTPGRVVGEPWDTHDGIAWHLAPDRERVVIVDDVRSQVVALATGETTPTPIGLPAAFSWQRLAPSD
jgi:hypothetical protein